MDLYNSKFSKSCTVCPSQVFWPTSCWLNSLTCPASTQYATPPYFGATTHANSVFSWIWWFKDWVKKTNNAINNSLAPSGSTMKTSRWIGREKHFVQPTWIITMTSARSIWACQGTSPRSSAHINTNYLSNTNTNHTNTSRQSVVHVYNNLIPRIPPVPGWKFHKTNPIHFQFALIMHSIYKK